jgi:hypothetical protein
MDGEFSRFDQGPESAHHPLAFSGARFFFDDGQIPDALSIDRSSRPRLCCKAGLVGQAMYLPIYERIEVELDALKAKEERMERARQRLK